jgi:UDP-N-acetylmuramoylalanine--D-glutamate ligase
VSPGPPTWLDGADRSAPWSELEVCVAGLGVSGFAAADALLQMGAHVTAVDERPVDALGGKVEVLDTLGVDIRLGDEAAHTLPAGAQLVVTSPGWRPDAPLLVAAAAAGVPVWGEVELAWRLRPIQDPAPWLVVTGTNGKTTTVRMLAAMLQADGRRAVAAGNVGTPLVQTVLADRDGAGHDVLAVELSSFQLHWALSPEPLAAAVLNVAPDHVDWHGSLADYVADKGHAYERARVACVYNVEDPQTERLVLAADVQDGCRAVGFTLGVPSVGMVGVVDDLLVDRAFVEQRHDSAAELATLSDVAPFAPHNVANALAAAALARAFGVRPGAVRDGLRGFRPDPHRIARVAQVGGVTYVDDSKATNPHAAAASLAVYERVVWVAGGLAKGASFDDLVVRAAARLRGVVLLGHDRADIAAALARHAPEVPVVEVANTDTGVMDEVVHAAARLAAAGDTVLLAPACASMDLFRDYGARGDAFAAAVWAMAGGVAGHRPVTGL